MPSTSTSFRTEKETLESLDIIAQDMGRSRNWVVNKAMQDFIAYQDWFKKQVQKGLKAADQGDFATEDEMAELFGKFGA